MCFSEIIRIFVPDIQNFHFYNNHYYYAYWYNYNPCCYCRILCGREVALRFGGALFITGFAYILDIDS